MSPLAQMHDATRPPLEKTVYDRATGKIVTVVRDDPSSAVKFTTEVEKKFFERMDKQLAKKEQRLKVSGVNGVECRLFVVLWWWWWCSWCSWCILLH